MHTLLQVVSGLGWDLSAWAAILVAAELITLVTVPSVLLSRRGQPLAALSWTLALVAVPVLGVLAWWLFGRSHLERKSLLRKRARWQVREGFAYLRPEMPAVPAEVGEVFNAIRRLPEGEAGGAFAPEAGNRVTVLKDGSETYAAMERAIAAAEHHLHLLLYTFEPDAMRRRFRDLLAERARSGLKVRLLLDAMGSFRTRSSFLRPIEEAGGEVAFFAPVKFFRRSLSFNFRNHRKILVADGRTAVYSGVDVRLLVPRRSDLPWTRLAGRSYFPDLLASGARIWEYLPTVLHGKTWVFDRDFCAAGSANLDTRSFKLNCFIRDAAANARMAQLFEQDLAQSAEVTLASLARTSAGQRLLESSTVSAASKRGTGCRPGLDRGLCLCAAAPGRCRPRPSPTPRRADPRF